MRFGGKSHRFSDFGDTDNNNKADFVIRLNFNVYKTWITEKELERDKKQRRPISLEEKHKNLKQGGNASGHQGENERQRKKSQQEHIKHVTRKFLEVSGSFSM